jgi:N-acyl-phosphatidylethanolamine-hydrolysing phospholipase D
MAGLMGWAAGTGLSATANFGCAPSKENRVQEYPTGIRSMTMKELAARKIHHGPGYFKNIFSQNGHGSFWRVAQWKLFGTNHFRQYYDDEPLSPVKPDWETIRRHTGLSVTFIKHSTLLIKDIDTYFMVDPIFQSPLPFIKDFSPLEFEIAEMPAPDHILLTHGHRDHLDERSLKQMAHETHLITPLGYNRLFIDLNMANRTKLDWFESWTDNRRTVTLTPANHWTMRSPVEGANRSLWGSFVFQSAAGPTIFIAGDTAYFDGFKEIGQDYDIDLAVFNLGAYEPRWFMANSHINPEETVRAFEELGAKRLMIVHWGTFRLGDEPVHFPPMDMDRALESFGLEKKRLPVSHGETYYFT